MDLQDLGGQVGAGQRDMLHTAGVGNAIVPPVHLKLEAASDCEGFPCGVHLLSTWKYRQNSDNVQFHTIQ